MNYVRNDEQLHSLKDLSTFNIVSLLKACKDLGTVSKLHAYIREHNFLGENSYVASSLITTYARCGALANAQEVVDGLRVIVRDVVIWNAIIAGYAKHGLGDESLNCFDNMQHEGQCPDAVTYICALKACGSIGALTRGEEIHEKVINFGMLEKNFLLGSTLVDMYCKCGVLGKAKQVLEELPIHMRDVVAWNALIAGYCKHQQGKEALKCFHSMQCEGHSPNAVTFTCALKACGNTEDVAMGEKIHDKIVSLGMLEKSIVLGNTLVDMYARCGALAKAHQVLDELPVPVWDVVTWNALTAGYTKHGQSEEALKCFDTMQYEGISPDAITYTCALKACGCIGAIARGKQIHGKIVSLGMLEENTILLSSLVDMYVKCAALAKARQVFDELHVSAQDVVTWNVLIAGYANHDEGEEALKCFDNMQREGPSPDVVTFTCILKACGSIGAIIKGEQIHDKIVNLGMLETNDVLGIALVDMYAKCGALAKAQEVFDELPVQNVILWTALIAGYAQQGQGEEALKCFDSMQWEGHSPDAVTITCILIACGNIGAVVKGEKIHDQIVNSDIVEKDIALGIAMVGMFARCGKLTEAQKVFNGLPVQDVVAWTELITGYAQQGHGEEALKCLDRMQCEGYSPDVVTFTCALKVCGIIGAATKGKDIHDKIVNLGVLQNNLLLGRTLVYMYARCGELTKAQQVFDKLPIRDAAAWTALVAGYVQQGQGEEALRCFGNMQRQGYSPDVATFTCALKACGSIGAVAKGKEIHDKLSSLGILEKNIVLGSALVDMYARCSALAMAQQTFDELLVQNVVTWTALITAYAQNGQAKEAINCFERMQSEGIRPDPAALVCVLNACSNSGLFNQAEMYFSRMATKYGITPCLDHYCCMVDAFGRAGKLNRALREIEKMLCADGPTWCALLGACCKWGDLKLGSLAFEHCVTSLESLV